MHDCRCRMPARLAVNVGLIGLDLLWVLAACVLLIAWVFNPFRLNLGPVHLTIHGGLKPLVLLLLALGLRYGLAWAGAQGRAPRPPVGDFPGFRAACLVLLDVLFMASLLLIPAVWLMGSWVGLSDPMPFCIDWGLHPALAPVIVLLVRLAVRQGLYRAYPPARGLWESGLFKKICFALISTYLIFGLLESVLGWTRFDVRLPPIVFQGKNNAGGIEISDTVPDAELIFRFQPGRSFAGRQINSLGFRDREVDPRKAPGSIRVICMGDSVTGQGRPGYSQYLHERLTNNPPLAGAWEAFNMGVHGYTSLQGLRLFQKQGRLLNPDIVTVYYGWNDHWLTDEPDRLRMGLAMRPLAGRIAELLRQKRIFRLVVWALSPVQHVAVRDRGEARVPRVAPDAYRSTLNAFVREIRAAGAIPVLITAPRRSLTRELLAKSYVVSVEQGQRTHDEYVELTRQVARESNVELLDLASLFADPACDGYFAGDGIHFDLYSQESCLTHEVVAQPGLMRVAEELDRKVRDITRTLAWQDRRPVTP